MGEVGREGCREMREDGWEGLGKRGGDRGRARRYGIVHEVKDGKRKGT
jgi:hypothetical protein